MSKLKSVITTLIILIMVLSISGPVMAETVDLIQQSSNTNDNNIKFNVKVNSGYSATLKVEDKNSIDINISVKEVGYLKDGKISFENSNFVIDYDRLDLNKMRINQDTNTKAISAESTNSGTKAISTSNTIMKSSAKETEKIDLSDVIESIKDNTIELREIEKGNDIIINLPIKFNKKGEIQKDELERKFKVKFEGKYVKSDKLEKNIQKENRLNIKWETNSELEIQDKITKYIKYDDRKTLINENIKTNLKENNLPLNKTELQVTMPKVDGELPSEVIVISENTAYEKGGEKLKVVEEQKENINNNYNWNNESEINIVYIYNKQVDEADIETKVQAKETLLQNQEIQSQENRNVTHLQEQSGNLVNISMNGIDNINKGYEYTNLKLDEENKLETNFEEEIEIEVGYSKLVGEIILNEENDSLVEDKKIKASKEEIEKILGKDGKIIIEKENGEEIGTLDENNEEVNIIGINNIIIKIENPISEGKLKLREEKKLKSLGTSNEEIKKTEKIVNKIKEIVKKDDKEILNTEIEKEIKLEEPTSKVNVEVSNSNLSTVEENKDVIITVVLEKNNVSDRLYTNPEIEITLPKSVEKIELTDARIFYEDELQPLGISTDKNNIKINLQGSQTQYGEQISAKGSLLRIVGNVTLDNLTPSQEDKINVTVKNNDSNEIVTESIKENIVAPSGLIMTNEISSENKTAVSQESKKDNLQINAYSNSKQLKITDNIVNNMNDNLTGVEIFGTIPFEGNTTKDGKNEDLGSTFNTSLISDIQIIGENKIDNQGSNIENNETKIYYSEKVDPTKDLKDPINGWSEQRTANSKNYIVAIGNTLSHGASISVSYNINIPSNINYEEKSNSIYSVYYDTNAEQGETKSILSATPNDIETESIPKIETNISCKEDYSKKDITEKDLMQPGHKITYTIKLKNTGTNTANNVITNVSMEDKIRGNINKLNYFTNIDVSNGTEQDKITEKNGENFNVKVGNIKVNEEVSIKVSVQLSTAFVENDETTFISNSKADNSTESSKKIFNNKFGHGDVIVSINFDSFSSYFDYDDEVKETLEIKNLSSYEVSNFKFELPLDKNLTFKSGDNIEYDKTNNKMYVTVDKLSPNDKKVYSYYLVVKYSNTTESTLLSRGYASYNENGNTVNVESNELNYKVGISSNIKATLTSNIPEGELLDTDKLIYYINIKNSTNEEATIYFSDTIPKELNMESDTLTVDNVVKEKHLYNSISGYNLTIGKNSNILITLTTIPTRIELKGKKVSIENKPIFEVNGKKSIINSLKHTIVGSESINTVTPTDKEIEESEQSGTDTNAFNITGKVWKDDNSNGIRDNNEKGIKNIKLTLYKSDSQEPYKVNNKEITAISDDSGNYNLYNVEKGNYVVTANFDDNYTITSYKVNTSNKSIDSDFKENTSVEGFKAITDTITITDANEYNIDLGLIDSRRFDFSLNKTILKVSLSRSGAKTDTTLFNERKTIKQEIIGRVVNSTTLTVEYKITVANLGNETGYVRKIEDEMPDGMNFNSEQNSGWYLKNNILYNTSLANKVINPGGKEEVKLVLTKKMTGNNVGMIHNTAVLSETYSESGLSEINSNNNSSYADVFTSIKTGIEESLEGLGYLLTTISFIALGIYVIKKNIIDR